MAFDYRVWLALVRSYDSATSTVSFMRLSTGYGACSLPSPTSRHFLVTYSQYASVMRENECPVKLTVDLIGGKWKTLILYYLKRGPQRTGVLQQRIEGVSKKMLTQQLRELERDGLI